MFRFDKAWFQLPKSSRRTRLRVEELEPRWVPYALSGNAWPKPQNITLSFMPDGASLGSYDQYGNEITSTLLADFDAKLGDRAAWQKEVMRAAQVWAQQTNINFSVIADDGRPRGVIDGSYQQGDPGFGDIRVGGWKADSNPSAYLAAAYLPPPAVNYSLAGDFEFNTHHNYNIGSDFDLFTVAAHEIGHSLGLMHSGDPTAVMYPSYPGLQTGLTTDDIAGIRAIYSAGAARTHDAVDRNYPNSGFHNAYSISFDSTKRRLFTGMDITHNQDNDFYKFVLPSGSNSIRIVVSSQGLSLLSPRFWLFDSAQTQLFYKTSYGSYGVKMDYTISGLTAGQTYYIRVSGAEPATPFGTGAYSMSFSAGTYEPYAIPLHNTTVANGSPIQSGTVINGMPVPDYYYPTADGHDHDHDEDHESDDSPLPTAASAVAHHVVSSLSIDGNLPGAASDVAGLVLTALTGGDSPADALSGQLPFAGPADAASLASAWESFGSDDETDANDEFAVDVNLF